MLIFALAMISASTPLDRCLDTGDAAQGITSAMSACYVADYLRADARLNATYRATMKRSSATRQAFLRTSQRAWIKQRDAACPIAEGDGVGTIELLNHPACLTKQTDRRTIWLSHYH